MTVINPRPTRTETPLPPPRVRRYRPEPGPRPRSRINTALIFIAVAGLITTVGLLYLFQTNHVAGLGFDMSQLQREREALALRNEQLNYSIARYESLDAVEQIALSEIGMDEAGDYVFLSVPRPVNDELPTAEPVSSGKSSVWERVWDRVTGHASATASDAEEMAP